MGYFWTGVASDSFFLHIGSFKIQLRKKISISTSLNKQYPPTVKLYCTILVIVVLIPLLTCLLQIMIARNKLCATLLKGLDRYFSDGRLDVKFDTKIANVDLDKRICTYENGIQEAYDLIIGCDGVQSRLAQY